MATNISPLFDNSFLEKLISKNEREIYARITVLDINELPIEYIEGNITDGSINIDGKSIVRRTCSLTMTAQEVNINEFYWGIKNKFILELGLKNNIDKNYPDIIWFKQGLYIITQFSTTESINKWTIKISGKDKMCLLNGDLSGHLPHETDFGKEEYHDLENDTITYTEIPIKDIIRYIVQDFGRELPQNIIINDIDDAGLELLEYHNEQPAYLYKELDSNEYKNMTLDGTIVCCYQLKKVLTLEQYNLIPDKYYFLRKIYKVDDYGFYRFDKNLTFDYAEYREHIIYGKDNIEYFKGTISDEFSITYDNLLDNIEFDEEPTLIKFLIADKDGNTYLSDKNYSLAKIEYGDTPGYFLTDLTYAGELIGKAGETLTSVLDKIKNMLSNFEYYYDINGKFIFQKKKEYISTSWSSNETDINRASIEPLLYGQDYMFNFIDSILISSFQNTPKITDIKNDYCVWSSYNNSGTEIPIHMRFAIDNKPKSYKPIRPLKEEIIKIIYNTNGDEINREKTYKYYDAPEIEPYNEEKLKKLEDFDKNINGFSASQTTVLLENGNKQTTIIYPYFAIEEYTTEDIVDIEYKNPYSVLVLQDKVMSEESYNNLITEYNKEKENNKDLDLYDFLKNKLSEDYYNRLITTTYKKYGVDWRELIYQMALDYRKCHNDDNFLYYIAQANPQYPTGRTGYEQYYIDLEGFWRTLYDPNPQQNYIPISYDEVKKYSYLVDDNNKNDVFDQIYIEQGYRNITYDEFNNPDLTISELYKFNKPLNENSEIFLYPVIGSDDCYLKYNQIYYISEDNKMLDKIAFSTNDSSYKDLNSVSLNNIYIKNLQNFTVPNDKNSEELLNFYSLSDDQINESSIFKVPYYPNNSELDTYKDYNNYDYLKFIDVCFDNIKEKFNTDWETYKQIYYVKDKQYISLLTYKQDANIENKEKVLWDNIYMSNFITFSYLIKNLFYSYNQSKENFDKELLQIKDLEQDNVLQNYLELNQEYLDQILNLIRDYYLKMAQFSSFSEINNQLFYELLIILGYTRQYIYNYFYNYHNYDYLQKNYSCLFDIFDYYYYDKKNEWEQVIEERIEGLSKEKENDTYLYRLNRLQQIYQYIKDLNSDIKRNFNETSFILDYQDTIEKITNMDELKQILLNIYQELNNSISQGEQVQISKEYINNLIENFSIYQTVQELKSDIRQYLFNPIKYLKEYLKSFKNLIIDDNISIIKNCYCDLYLLLEKIKSLPDLLTLKVENYNSIERYIYFNRKNQNDKIIFLPELYKKLNQDINNIQYLQQTLKEYLKETYDFQEYLIREDVNNFNELASEAIKQEKINYYRGYYDYNHEKIGGNFWSYNIYTNPHLLLFWFDFLDAQGAELEKISVPVIGQRTKVINDKNVKSIYYKDTPNIIFKRITDQDYDRKSGYTYINVNNNTETYFSISSKGKSAKERIDELLYEGSYAPESISISTIPVYYLEPNHYIFVRDDRSNIYGKYFIDKITIPLSYKKTMTITATKAITDIV